MIYNDEIENNKNERVKNMKNKIIFTILIGMLSFILCACGSENKMSTDEITDILCDGENILNVQNQTIEIPGVEGEYRFLYISDLHIIVQNDEIAENDVVTIQDRYNAFSNSQLHSAEEMYQYIIESVNQTDIDAVLMGGDMIDFLSKANWDYLKNGFDTLEKPYLFATADHDVCTWWTEYSEEEQKTIKDSMGLNLVNTLEYDDFIILSVGESTSQITKEALAEIEKVFDVGKPIILVTHVPFEPLEDDGLGEMSKANWGDRKLLWGDDCYYVPNETTQQFMDMIYAENSPVVAVLTGHLHFEYIGMINNQVKQYVFNPAYSGEVILFTIKGSSE